MPPVGFEPKFSAGEGPQTHALDRAATGTGIRAFSWYTRDVTAIQNMHGKEGITKIKNDSVCRS